MDPGLLQMQMREKPKQNRKNKSHSREKGKRGNKNISKTFTGKVDTLKHIEFREIQV